MTKTSQISRGVSALCLGVVLGTSGHAACREDQVELRGDWGQARFTVEIADDAGEQAQGLMHRKSMPTSAGMLFVYDRPSSLSFWMRNTLIPLDMLFIDPAGVVQHIHHNATPLDETAIFGGDGLLSVLEINGGLAERMGISVGSQLRHPAFENYQPAWPC
jgi:uncharacterized membrane protein (UPF0127 family)